MLAMKPRKNSPRPTSTPSIGITAASNIPINPNAMAEMPRIIEVMASVFRPAGAVTGLRVGTGLGVRGARAGAVPGVVARARAVGRATTPGNGGTEVPPGGAGTVKGFWQVGQVSERPTHSGVPDRC
jgi:hypothetical protein